jgi:hypothetical protein
MLFGHNLMMRMINDYRVVYIGGRYAGNKTSLAFRLAHELLKSGKYRYIVSNIHSVWNQPLDKVELRNGQWADTVVILDEAGEFMRTKAQADEWISYLRKLRIVLLLPSARKPTADVMSLRIVRTMDWSVIGIPLCNFRVRLSTDEYDEKFSFKWWNPSEIYGIYDTEGYPANDAPALLEWMKDVTKQASIKLGYNTSSVSGKRVTTIDSVGLEDMVVNIESTLDNFQKIQKEQSKTLSVLESRKGKRWKQR